MSSADLLLRVRADIGQASSALSMLSRQLGTFSRSAGLGTGGVLGVAAFGSAVVAGMGKSVQASMQFNDAFADVVRTVNDADKVGGFDKLRTNIIDLSKRIPVTANELASIAAQGGQMNVPADQLMNFTEVVARLGKTTNLSTAQAAQGLGMLANVTHEQDWGKLGAEISALGKMNVGGESQVLDMGQRIALVGTQLGLLPSQILGIGAAVSDTGIEAEMGGSAISRVFLQMQTAVSAAAMGIVSSSKDIRDATQRVGDLGEDLGLAQEARSELFTRRGTLKRGVSKSTLHAADIRIARLQREQSDQQSDLFDMQHPGQKELGAFADIAGLSTGDFSKMVKQEPNEAFLAMVSGLGKHKAAGEDIFALLDKAGINNIRELQTIAGLAGTQDHLVALQRVAAVQAGEGGAFGLLTPGGSVQPKLGAGPALTTSSDIKMNTDWAHQVMLMNDLASKEIAIGDKVAPRFVQAEKDALDLVDHLSKSSSIFDGMVSNFDKIAPALLLLSGFNALGGLGSLTKLFGRGGGPPATPGLPTPPSPIGTPGPMNLLNFIGAGASVGIGLLTPAIAHAILQQIPGYDPDAAKKMGVSTNPIGDAIANGIHVDVGGVKVDGASAEQVWDAVKSKFIAAFNEATRSPAVSPNLAGAGYLTP